MRPAIRAISRVHSCTPSLTFMRRVIVQVLNRHSRRHRCRLKMRNTNQRSGWRGMRHRGVTKRNNPQKSTFVRRVQSPTHQASAISPCSMLSCRATPPITSHCSLVDVLMRSLVVRSCRVHARGTPRYCGKPRKFLHSFTSTFK